MTTLPNLPAPKYSKLSLLADLADQEIGVYSYPVKRKGQPRALLPNRAAIAWLEADKAATEIEDTIEDPADGLIYTFAVGRVNKSYPRPMFQVINDEAFSGFRGIGGTACPCGDFSRTAYCDEHGELDYDWNRRTWVRPGTSIWYEHHPEDRPAPVDRRPDGQPTLTGARPPGAGSLYDRMFGQPLPARGADQVLNFGTSQCTCSMCRDAGLPESNPENRPTTSGRVPDILDLTRVPNGLTGPYEQWVDRVLGLQSGTIRIEGLFGEGTITFEEEPGDRPA